MVRSGLMVTEYNSKKSAHAHSEMKNVKNVTVMGTKYAPKKVKVDCVYFLIFKLSTYSSASSGTSVAPHILISRAPIGASADVQQQY